MTNRVRFNDNVEVFIYNDDVSDVEIKKKVSIYDKWNKLKKAA